MTNTDRAQNITYVLEAASRAESMLRQLGGQGENLGELLASMPVTLPRDVVSDLHQLRMQRNNIAHSTHKLSPADLGAAVETARHVLPSLEQMVRSAGHKPESRGEYEKERIRQEKAKQLLALQAAQRAVRQGMATPQQVQMVEAEQQRINNKRIKKERAAREKAEREAQWAAEQEAKRIADDAEKARLAEEKAKKIARAEQDKAVFSPAIRLVQWLGGLTLLYVVWIAWHGHLLSDIAFLPRVMWDVGCVVLVLIAAFLLMMGAPGGETDGKDATGIGAMAGLLGALICAAMWWYSKSPVLLLIATLHAAVFVVYTTYSKRFESKAT